MAGFSERFITAVKRNQGRHDPCASSPNEMCFYYNGLDQKLIVGEALGSYFYTLTTKRTQTGSKQEKEMLSLFK